MVGKRPRWTRSAAVGGLTLLAGTACYTYQPLTAADPAPGTPMALVLNDQGRAAVADSVGPGVRRVDGTLVRSTNDRWVVAVSELLDIDGRRTKWSGETVGFQRAYVAIPQERQFSKRRTILLVSTVAAGLATIIATRHLFGLSLPLIDTGGDGGGQGQ